MHVIIRAADTMARNTVLFKMYFSSELPIPIFNYRHHSITQTNLTFEGYMNSSHDMMEYISKANFENGPLAGTK